MRNKIIIAILITIFLVNIIDKTYSQGTSINTTGTDAHSSAILDVSDTARGVLIPRMTKVQKLAIPSPAEGLVVYQTNDSTGFWYFDGLKWVYGIGAYGTANAWSLTGNAGTNATSNFIGTIDAKDLVFATNNSEKLRILSSGNIGIGTNNPASLLQIGTNGLLIRSSGEKQNKGV